MITQTYNSETEPITKALNKHFQTTNGHTKILAVYIQSAVNLISGKLIKEEKVVGRFTCGVDVYIHEVTSLNNERILLVGLPLGGPITSIFIEIMYAAGIKDIMFFGSCGALTDNIDTLDLVIPINAYRDEGTSYHYMPASDFIDKPMNDNIIKIATDLGIDNKEVTTWTTDGFLRETEYHREKRIEQGCSVVDMECASSQAVAYYMKQNNKSINIHNLFYVADTLKSNNWNPVAHRMSLNYEERFEEIVRSAINIFEHI